MICVIIFNLNYHNFESKSPQCNDWFRAWTLVKLAFMAMHKVRTKESAFDNN
jgi:hypothetical protein